MRIISGKFKGRRFDPPLKKCNTRPTMDMAKEAIFNILYNSYDFETIRVVDLFGGTGSISFEFVSRGCKDVTWVENFYLCNQFVKKVKDTLNIDKEMKLVKNDAIRFLSNSERKFDIVFADPPYNFKYSKKVIDLIFERELIKEGGILIFEHDKRNDFSIYPNFVELKKYGTNWFSLFAPIS